MMTRKFLLSAVVATSVGAFGGIAYAAPAQLGTHPTSLGKVVTDSQGMTLYTFDKDKNGMSACYDKCATNWPPAIAPAGATPGKDFGLTKRKDGSMQWTYYGKPLYLWSKDAKPGDTTGDGVFGVWHAAVEK